MAKFIKYTSVVHLLLIVSLIGSCDSNSVNKGVYHWETEFDLAASEVEFLNTQKISKIYAKFFDITLSPDGRAMPVAKVEFAEPPEQEIIPTIYIVTDVFKNLDSIEIKNLARKTYEQVQVLSPQKEFSEIQIDCDWMASIKNKYFYYLECLKNEIGEAQLSATIRLYQYKYPNLAGVPPVDKGVLMYYNMGDIKSYEETNSILNNKIGEQYLGFGDYPIPLDFALPNFSWSLLFRYGEFRQIVPSLTATNLNDTSIFEEGKNHYYSVKMDTLYQGVFLRFGDELRYEDCSEDELIAAAKLLSSEKNQDHTTLLFYDLKPKITNESDKINHVFAAFEQ